MKIPKIIKYGISILIILVVGIYISNRLAEPNFDSDKWKNWTETESEMSLRWDMMRSLGKNHELKGMNKAKIIELLGTPDSELKSTFTYYLGYSKRGINQGYLDIVFDENGIVVDYSVTDT
ncbi:hypothetical protein [Maribacter spongiicola]|uniref:hypothetical protein n=1 Tax=Maribacter spongiicola TaxID=1206753 RepID=UPI003F99E323